MLSVTAVGLFTVKRCTMGQFVFRGLAVLSVQHSGPKNTWGGRGGGYNQV